MGYDLITCVQNLFFVLVDELDPFSVSTPTNFHSNKQQKFRGSIFRFCHVGSHYPGPKSCWCCSQSSGKCLNGSKMLFEIVQREVGKARQLTSAQSEKFRDLVAMTRPSQKAMARSTAMGQASHGPGQPWAMASHGPWPGQENIWKWEMWLDTWLDVTCRGILPLCWLNCTKWFRGKNAKRFTPGWATYPIPTLQLAFVMLNGDGKATADWTQPLDSHLWTVGKTAWNSNGDWDPRQTCRSRPNMEFIAVYYLHHI